MRRRHPLLIGHRGAAACAPESTGASIRRARALGVDMIELDVQVTADDRLVIFHDDRVDRTTNGRGPLARFRYAQLARLDAGGWFSPAFAGERVLLVSEAIRLIRPPCRINLELKSTAKPARLISQLVHSLRRAKAGPRVLVSSFDPSLLARMQRAGPGIARAIGLSCVALHPHVSLVTPPLVDRVHRAGLRLHVWTVDRLRDARRLLTMGVDGIVTNRPDRIGPALRGA